MVFAGARFPSLLMKLFEWLWPSALNYFRQTHAEKYVVKSRQAYDFVPYLFYYYCNDIDTKVPNKNSIQHTVPQLQGVS